MHFSATVPLVNIEWLFSLTTTLFGISMTMPQLVRIVRRRDAAGVSVMAHLGSFVAYLGLISYAASQGTETGVAALVLPAAVELLTLLAAMRWRGEWSGKFVPTSLTARLGGGLFVGGWDALGVLLVSSAAFAYTPAVWSAWKSPDVSGVSRLAWFMAAGYGVSWGALGLIQGDLAIALSGVVNIVFPLLVVLGVSVRRPTVVELPEQRRPREPLQAPVDVTK